jgi:hypothetical protein
MTISVVHITVRPEQAVAVYGMWRERAASDKWDYWIVHDVCGPVVPHSVDGGYKVLVAPGVGPVLALNFGAFVSEGDVIVTAADDLEPPVGWDALVSGRLANRMGFPAVLAVSDAVQARLLTHPILTRERWVQQDRVVVAPVYDASHGLYGDDEFTERAYGDGVVVEARDVVFRHHNPAVTGKGKDAAFLNHNSKDNAEMGRRLFLSRNPGCSR